MQLLDMSSPQYTKLADKVMEAASSNMSHALAFAHQKMNLPAPGLLMLTAQAIIATMSTSLTLVAKYEDVRSDGTIDPQKAETVMNEIATREVLAFIGLYAAMAMDKITIHSMENDEDPEATSARASYETSSNALKLKMALDAWERAFPDKRAEDFFHPLLIEAARSDTATLLSYGPTSSMSIN